MRPRHAAAILCTVSRCTTIELDVPPGGGSITYDGKEFDLKKIDFHTPSEH